MIPPVGEPIVPRLRRGIAEFDWSFSGRYRPIFVDSGTTALRLAIQTAQLRRDSGGTIWVPAYGCPNIVVACNTAGSLPVLYDIDVDSPFFAAGPSAPTDTIAVIAAHFLGLRHPAPAIMEVTRRNDALLIEDSAQRFPGTGDALFGDAVVLSFGRGKPVSLMEGGCLLVRPHLYDLASQAMYCYRRGDIGRAGDIKRRLHDRALNPHIYGLARRMPGLHIGRVVYSTAPSPRLLGPRLVELASRAASSYWTERTWAERQRRTATFIEEHFPELQPLPHLLGQQDQRLLRVPLLAANPQDAAAAMRRALGLGLGATRLYGRALTDIDGAPKDLAGPCARARLFAARLVTLPVLPGGNHLAPGDA